MISSNSDGKNFRRSAGLSGDRSPLAMGISVPSSQYICIGTETSLDLTTLATPLSYNPGKNNLLIQSTAGSFIRNVDYFETSSTTISFAVPPQPGEILSITVIVAFSGNSVAQVRNDEYSINNATAGTNTVITDFSFPYNANPSKRHGAILVFVNGILQQRSANNQVGGDADYAEIQVGTTGNTNQIQFSSNLIGGENITITRPYQVMDDAGASTAFNNSRLSDIQSSMTEGFQPFITSSNTISVPSTTIVNRAQIPDLSQNLKAQFGIERIMTQSIFQIQNEFGPNGEPVWGVVNDTFGQIRFVGNASSQTGTYGQYAQLSSSTDYVEVTFYGTGINLLSFMNPASGWSVVASVDGGSNGSNLFLANASQPHGARNYSVSNPINAFSGLTLGTHTVKFTSNLPSVIFYGFEILNESSTIKVNPGVSYINGKKITTAAQASISHNTTFDEGTLGTKGGRVTVYQKADGTIAKTVTPVDTTALYLTSASHANEEVARTYHWREFGAGRTANDDFSNLLTSSNRAFTLDDGTTTLVGSTVTSVSEGLYLQSNASFLTFTFVGTGLDIMRVDDASGGSDNFTYSIDGATAATFATSGNTSKRITKVVSGLPYGTHTFKLTRVTAATFSISVFQFIVYQPKKLALLAGEVEIADYNVMADYVANTVAGVDTIGTGVLRKSSVREMVYVEGTGGTSSWSIGALDPVNFPGGYEVATDRTGAYLEYTFFGTGIEFRSRTASNRSANISVTFNTLAATTANFAALTSSTYGTGVTFTSGVLDLLDASITSGVGVSIKGLPLAKYTVRFTNNTASSFLLMDVLDIITPIHSAKSNIAADYQNTLSVGSQGMSDNRKFTPVKEAISLKKNWGQAVGITNGVSTSSTSAVPMPDTSFTLKTNGGDIVASFFGRFSFAGVIGASTLNVMIFMDGVQVSRNIQHDSLGAGINFVISNEIRVPASPGVHKLDAYWQVSSGTATAAQFDRILIVEEV